jgi:hypothetical protein
VNARERRAKPFTPALARMSMVLVSGGLLAGISAAGTPGFETVPDQSPAQLLSPAMVSGVNFHVVDPVHGDGLAGRFPIARGVHLYTAVGICTTFQMSRSRRSSHVSPNPRDICRGHELRIGGPRQIFLRRGQKLAMRSWVRHAKSVLQAQGATTA